MSEIKEITVSSHSGYVIVSEAYNDRITITEDSVTYKYEPFTATETNPERNWSYRTDSPVFRHQFEIISSMTEKLKNSNYEPKYIDLSNTEFIITYKDGTEFSKTFCADGAEEYENILKEIKTLVPGCEYIPAVLLTEEDFEKNI